VLNSVCSKHSVRSYKLDKVLLQYFHNLPSQSGIRKAWYLVFLCRLPGNTR